MARQFRLSDHSIIAFATSDPDLARKFYEDTLGLPLVSDDKPIAVVFDAHGTMLRVPLSKRQTPPDILYSAGKC
jgi:catechol 2,3-dioxygenase-like lactoylglutathione lyase family enzyme